MGLEKKINFPSANNFLISHDTPHRLGTGDWLARTVTGTNAGALGVQLVTSHIQGRGAKKRTPWGIDGPPGATGVLFGGLPPVKGVWGCPR